MADKSWRKNYSQGNFAPPKGLDNLTREEYEQATQLYRLLSGGGDIAKPKAQRLRTMVSPQANRLADEMLREKERRMGGAMADWDMPMAAAMGPVQGAGAAAGWLAAPAVMSIMGAAPDIPATMNNKGDAQVFGKQGQLLQATPGKAAPRMGPGMRAMFLPFLVNALATRAPKALEGLGTLTAPLVEKLPASAKAQLLKILGEDTSREFSPEEQALINMTYPSRRQR